MTTAYRLAEPPGAAHPFGPAPPFSADSPAAPPGLHWLTSAFGDAPAATARSPATLDQHLTQCRHRHGRLAALACGAASVHRFIAARFVTTLAVALMVIGGALLLG